MALKFVTTFAALGFLLCTGAASTTSAQQAKPQLAVADSLAARGKAIFEMRGCSSCHYIGGGKSAGPDLQGVTERRKREWLARWIKDPSAMIESGDPVAKKLFKDFWGVKMPNLRLSDEEIEAVITYLASRDADR